MDIIWAETKAVPATIEWAKIEVEMQPDAEVDISQIELSINTKDNKGKVFIDNIQFIENQYQKCCAFIELPDAPHSYEGKSGMAVFVNSTEDGLEFLPMGSGGSGTPGADGQSIVWKGEWSDTAAYSPLDAFTYQGQSYICIAATTGTMPSNTQFFNLMVAKGDIGPQGIQGIQGPEGQIGPVGPQGAQGAEGIQGPAGAQGLEGPQGIQGPIGETGFKWRFTWSSTVIYIEGDSFEYNGSSYVCHTTAVAGTLPTNSAYFSLMAAKGAAGTGGAGTGAATFIELTDTPSSYTGSAGMVPTVSPEEDRVVFSLPPVGPQGIQGETGDIGPAGPQGIQGEIGPEGPQGIQGEIGPIGPAGPQGIQGETGPEGPQGQQGIQGEIGPIGPEGPQGIQGETGPAGADGSAGVSSIKIKDNPAMLGDIELIAGSGVILSQDDNLKTITIESTSGGPVDTGDTLFEDFEGDPLFSTGTWYRTTEAALTGTKSLRAPAIGASQTTEFTHTFEIDTDGKVSFYHMVESESVSYDYFTFSVDGVEKLRVGGVKTSFSYFEELLTAGIHTIKFFYRKDGGGVGGRDTVFIDNFTINDIKYAEGEKPLIIANAAQIRQVPIDKPTATGTVPIFNGTDITWEVPPGSGVTTELQGIDVDTSAQLDGYVLTFDAASGKLLLKPKPGGGGEPISQMLTLRTKNTMYGGLIYPFALTSTTYLP